jgi:hypothetical protein
MNRHFAAGAVDLHRRAIERRSKLKSRKCSGDSVAAGVCPTKNPAAPQPDFDLSNDVA